MFSPDENLLEIIARTLCVYLVLLVVLRLAGKRELGQMEPFDVVVLLLISEAVQNAIIGGDQSLTGGLVAAGLLIGANKTIAVARDRIPRLRSALESSPTELVRDGRFLHEEMQKEELEEREVMMAIRGHGLAEVEDVYLAVLETDGSISVIPEDNKPQSARRRRPLKRR